MFGRKQAAIVASEFLGTGFLSLILLSVHGATIGALAFFFAIGAALALATMTAVFGGLGGGHFNPVVTIGLWVVRQVKTVPALVYIVAQMLGAWAAYAVYTYFIGTHLPDSTLTPSAVMFWMEAVGALLLALAYAAMVFERATVAKRAVVVGVAYGLAIMVASHYSQFGDLAGMVNPAVAFSMRSFGVVTSLGWGVYALGPLLGAVVGFTVYDLLFAPESNLVTASAAVSSRLSGSTRPQRAAAAPTATVAAKPAAKSSAKRTTRSTAARGRKATTTRTRK